MPEAAIEQSSQSAKVLARLIRRVGPCRLEARRSAGPFQALVQSVAHQPLNGTAAKTILKRVIAIYAGRKFPAPEDLLATPDERLGGAGLSVAKTAGLKDIGATQLEGIAPSSRASARLHSEQL